MNATATAPAAADAAPLLEARNVSKYFGAVVAIEGVSLEVRAGEIVGIAGVDGNGQSELIDALTGLRQPASGRIVVGGKDVTNASARDVLDNGMGHIPEDRQRRGLVLDEDVGAVDYRARYFGRAASGMRGYEFYRVAVAHVPERDVDMVRAAQQCIPADGASHGR